MFFKQCFIVWSGPKEFLAIVYLLTYVENSPVIQFGPRWGYTCDLSPTILFKLLHSFLSVRNLHSNLARIQNSRPHKLPRVTLAYSMALSTSEWTERPEHG